MPDGAELLPVGAKSQGDASPYGCFQTRKMDADSLLYSSRSIYLHFPKGIAKKANGQTEKISFYQIPDGERPARLANCVIPATDKARKLLTAKLRGTSSAQSGVTTSNTQKAGATTSSGGCDGERITEYVILVYPTHIEIYLTVVICAEAGVM